MYVVFSERFEDHEPIRYFYGYYEDHNRANEVALQLNNTFKNHAEATFCVIHINDVEELREWNIKGC